MDWYYIIEYFIYQLYRYSNSADLHGIMVVCFTNVHSTYKANLFSSLSKMSVEYLAQWHKVGTQIALFLVWSLLLILFLSHEKYVYQSIH